MSERALLTVAGRPVTNVLTYALRAALREVARRRADERARRRANMTVVDGGRDRQA